MCRKTTNNGVSDKNSMLKNMINFKVFHVRTGGLVSDHNANSDKWQKQKFFHTNQVSFRKQFLASSKLIQSLDTA